MGDAQRRVADLEVVSSSLAGRASSLILLTALAAACGAAQQVEAGMPAGAAIFDQTDPTCLPNPDGRSFRCTLARAPVAEVTGFLGAKEVLAIDDKVGGGCIGLDTAGMQWDCFIGQDAVDREIIGPDFLGEPVLGPGVG